VLAGLQEATLRALRARDQASAFRELLAAAKAAIGADKGVVFVHGAAQCVTSVGCDAVVAACLVRASPGISGGKSPREGNGSPIVLDVARDVGAGETRERLLCAGVRFLHGVPVIVPGEKTHGRLLAGFGDRLRATRDGKRLLALYANAVAALAGRIAADAAGRSVAAADATAGIETHERLGLATASGKIGMWDWDIAANRVTWTASLYRLHGVQPGNFEHTVEGFAALVHPGDLARVRSAIERSLASTQPYEVEFRVRRPDGEIVWLYTNALVLRDEGRPVRMVGATMDVTERKLAELALRESEEKFRTLARFAPVGIFVTDARGDVTFANESWQALTTAARAVVMGDWLDRVHPDDRARVAKEWSAAVRSRRECALEFRFLRTDGSVAWVQLRAVRFDDSRGGGHLGTAIEITERKAAEFALRESEKRFRNLANRAPVGIFMTDPQGETVFVNENWCALTGLAPQDAQGDGWLRIVHPEDRSRVRAGWDEAVRSGVASAAEYRFQRTDGKVVWVQGNAVQLRDAAGRVAGYVGTIADVTVRKQAEDALRESEERFRRMADHSPIVVWVSGPDGRRTYHNPRWHELTGLAEDRSLGKGWLAAVHPEDRAAVRAALADANGKRVAFRREYRLRRHDGVFRWAIDTAAPHFDGAGVFRGHIGSLIDITDRKEAEEQARAAQTQLQAQAGELERKVTERTASLREAIAQMEEFSYSVSHDLRAPLRAMNAYAEVLIEDYGAQLDDTARSHLERIRRSSARMEKLTHDVLTYSRIARTEIQLAPTDVGKLVRELIDQYAELQPAAATVKIAGPLLPVLAHESALAQCLGNLLTNAVKFVAPGERPKIRVSTHTAGGRVRICVDDEGIGIPPQYHAALFRVFERLPTRVHYEGTGIGLAIVRKAAEKMGGRCGVESDGRRGSRFWVELAGA
jgi:PAS domain S-box-containing protein